MKELINKINEYCLNSECMQPLTLAQQLMSDIDGVPMHGPIHHYIVPASVLTAYNNLYGSKEQLVIQLLEAEKRAITVPGANCANCGACGASMGVGIAYSIICETKPLSTNVWSKTLEITSLCNLEISKHGGPRCCKRDTNLALLVATSNSKRLFDFDFGEEQSDSIVCSHFSKNQQCLSTQCLFFPTNK